VDAAMWSIVSYYVRISNVSMTHQ